ncbi:hypothetical protein SAMN06295888_12932, partial [Desulfonatronum zhilinae]
MALLEEYALTHCVFDSATYADPEIGRVHLERLKETLLAEGVVRDLRDGEWSRVFHAGNRSWHLMGKELLKKLKTQNRLVPYPAVSQDAPFSDVEWCNEAIASYQNKPLTGIVTSFELAKTFHGNPLIASVDRLPSSPWWKDRSISTTLRRTKEEYLRLLEPLFRCAKSIMFIDGHLDPTKERYHDFIRLLGPLTRLKRKPLIEIHRGCYSGSGPDRVLLREQELQDIFRINCAKLIKPLDFRLFRRIYGFGFAMIFLFEHIVEGWRGACERDPKSL